MSQIKKPSFFRSYIRPIQLAVFRANVQLKNFNISGLDVILVTAESIWQVRPVETQLLPSIVAHLCGQPLRLDQTQGYYHKEILRSSKVNFS